MSKEIYKEGAKIQAWTDYETVGPWEEICKSPPNDR